MVLHGLKRIFQKSTPDLSSSDRTDQLRSKTIYSGTVNLSTELVKPGSNRYKTYNGPFEVVNKNGNSSLVASASYSALLDITKGKVLLNKLPLTNSSSHYYEKNFGNGEIYVGNYQQFDGSFFSGAGPTGCHDSVLVYDLSTTGFTGPGSYTGNSIGNTGVGVTGTVGWNQNIFIDPKHCYYSDPCASNASYMKFVDINFQGPTGSTGITGPSQYYAQKIINGDQYNGFRFPMSNFTLTCKQPNLSQTDGPLFCPPEPPNLSNFVIPSKDYGGIPFVLTPPSTSSPGAFSYSSDNLSTATISGSTVTIGNVGTSTITATQAASGNYSQGSISIPFVVNPGSPNLSNFSILPTPKKVGDVFMLSAPSSSNSLGAFIYSSLSTSVTISGNIVTVVGIDNPIIITATQTASVNYSQGSIQASFNVIPPTAIYSWTNIPNSQNSPPGVVTPYIVGLQPGFTLTGGSVYYSGGVLNTDNNTKGPLTLTFENANSTSTMTLNFTITESNPASFFNFTFNPPIVWTWEPERSYSGDILWPIAYWEQPDSYPYSFQAYYILGTVSDLPYVPWVGTLTGYNT